MGASGYAMATKWCSLDFQPERAKGKAWPWSGCGDADVKRGSALSLSVEENLMLPPVVRAPPWAYS